MRIVFRFQASRDRQRPEGHSSGRWRSRLAPVLLVLLTTGCHSEPDGYSPELRYPLRADPLVLRVPPVTPTAPPPSGKLDEVIVAFPAQGGAILRMDALLPERQKPFAQALDEFFGTPASPLVKLPDGHDANLSGLTLNPESLAQGSRIYRRNCVQCHGLSGDGRGPTGPWLYPHPRDVRSGIFKLAVGNGKPTMEALRHVVRAGVPGTSMPVFDSIPPADLDALTAYVVHLSVRGETEARTLQRLLDPEADDTEDVRTTITEVLPIVLRQWSDAQQPGFPIPGPASEPPATVDAESVKRGFALFNGAAGCASCHVNFGRQEQFRYDAWGAAGRVADLTRNEYRWGKADADFARKIRHGIPGAGMPANPGLTEEQVRDLVNFVRELPFPTRLPDDVRAAVYP